jgi:hypothetical protein
VLPQDLFPHAPAEGFVLTSPATREYNCIAWAAGSQAEWWWPDFGFISYWPEHVPRLETLDAFYAIRVAPMGAWSPASKRWRSMP